MSLGHTVSDHGDLRHYDAGRRRALNLLRFMEQDRYLNRRKQAYVAHVQRKVHARRYRASDAPTLWAHWLKDGLKRYLRARPRLDGASFTEEFMTELAEEVAEREYARVLRGYYVDMTVDGQVGARGHLHAVRW